MTLEKTPAATSVPSQARINNTEDTKSSSKSTGQESSQHLVWHNPWRVGLGFFSCFVLYWAYIVVIQRYWIHEYFELALPGLGKTDYRKFTMRSHMTFGTVAILLSFIQMTTPFTSGWKQNKDTLMRGNIYRRIHRYSGRVYAMCAIMAFFFGQWFIFLKEFVLVGGYNMGVSFSIAGFFIAYFAFMTWKTAPIKDGSSVYTIEDHRNYAIRSFSQIIAPILYRFWYFMLAIFQQYRMPYFYDRNSNKSEKLICDDRDVCQDYLRSFDAIYAWLYWISAWIVAEVIIAYLPRHQKQTITTTVSVPRDETQIPLMSHLHPKTTVNNLPGDNDESVNGSYSIQKENVAARPITNDKKNDNMNTSVINFFGCLLAVLSAIGTIPFIYLTVVLSGNNS